MQPPNSLLACLLIPLLLAGATLSLSAASPQRETALLTEVQTPIVANGKQVGMMKLPAGTKVSIVSELPDGAMVSRSGFEPFKVAKAAIAASSTTPAAASTPVAASSPPATKPELPAAQTSLPVVPPPSDRQPMPFDPTRNNLKDQEAYFSANQVLNNVPSSDGSGKAPALNRDETRLIGFDLAAGKVASDTTIKPGVIEHGLAVAGGRLFLSLDDGSLVAME